MESNSILIENQSNLRFRSFNRTWSVNSLVHFRLSDLWSSILVPQVRIGWCQYQPSYLGITECKVPTPLTNYQVIPFFEKLLLFWDSNQWSSNTNKRQNSRYLWMSRYLTSRHFLFLCENNSSDFQIMFEPIIRITDNFTLTVNKVISIDCIQHKILVCDQQSVPNSEDWLLRTYIDLYGIRKKKLLSFKKLALKELLK